MGVKMAKTERDKLKDRRAAIRRSLMRWGAATQTSKHKQAEIKEYLELIESAADLSPKELTGMPRGNDISDPTALTAEKIIKMQDGYRQRIADITEDISDLMDFVANIDDILTAFPEDERRVIETRYRRFRGERKDPWVKTALQMHMSEDGIKKVERRAVDRMMGYIKVDAN